MKMQTYSKCLIFKQVGAYFPYRFCFVLFFIAPSIPILVYDTTQYLMSLRNCTKSLPYKIDLTKDKVFGLVLDGYLSVKFSSVS